MSTKVASVTVAGLKTTSEWVDHLVVEVYSDASLIQLVDTQISNVSWDGTHNNQKDLIVFNGLVYGQDYWLRAGVVAPESGATTWSASLEIQAGTSTAPSCTYSGTYTATSSGVTYNVTPANVPSDIDHYEAVWTYDGTVPANTIKPYWTGEPTGTQFSFFAGGYIGQVVTAFVRAVNTSSLQQSWVSLGQQTVEVNLSGNFVGTIDGIAASDIAVAAISGVNKNMLPDSDFKFGDVYWAAPSGKTALVWEPQGGANGGGAFVYTGTGGEQGLSAEMDAWDFLNQKPSQLTVVPGQEYALSCFIASSSAGGASIKILSTDKATTYLTVSGVAGSSGREVGTWTTPVGVTAICVGLFIDAPGALPQGSITSFSAPQLEVGSFATAYKSNSFDDGTAKIPRAVVPASFVGVWNSIAVYDETEEVFHQGNYWVSLAENTNSPPTTTNPAWQLIGPTPSAILTSFQEPVTVWNPYTQYVPYQEAQDQGLYWVCVKPNNNSRPSSGNPNWEQVGAIPTPAAPIQPWDSTKDYPVQQEVTYNSKISGTGNLTKAPTIVAQTTRQNAWSNPNNAAGSSGFATCALHSTSNSVNKANLLQLTGFDFSSIPDTAKITGISVSWNRVQTSGTSATYDDTITLLGLSGAVTDHVPSYPNGEWPTTAAVVQYGGANDLWGQMPSVAQIKASTFGVQLGCECTLEPGNGSDIELNSVTITVYYATQNLGAANYYVALVENTGKQPDISPTYWQLVGPATVDAMQDGQDYVKVRSTAINNGQVDLSKAGVIEKNLGNIEDDPTTGRSTVLRFEFNYGGSSSAFWALVGTWTTTGFGGRNLNMVWHGGAGFNSGGTVNQQAQQTLVVRSGNGASAPNLSGAMTSAIGGGGLGLPMSKIKVVAHGGSTSPTNTVWDIYVEYNPFTTGHIDVSLAYGDTFSYNGSVASDPGTNAQTILTATGGQILTPDMHLPNRVGQYDSGSNFRTIGLVNVHFESGADVTGNHQSATTASLIGHTTDSLSEGSSHFYITNGSGLGGVSAWDSSSKRALIDFTENHPNKNADNIPVGSAYGIMTLARQNAGLDNSGNLLFKSTKFYTFDANQAIGTSSDAITPTINIVTHGYKVALIFTLIISAPSTADVVVQAQLYRDGTPILGFSTFGEIGIVAGGVQTTALIAGDNSPSAAPHTYQVYLSFGYSGSGNTGSPTLVGGSIIAWEYA